MARDDEEDFTYPALVNRWRRERAATALTKMDGHFYEAFDQRLRELREEYTREHAVNPATPKVLILQDELMNLQRVREDLYDLRERKIVTAALIAARGGHPDRSHLTKEEDILFDEVLKVLRDARRNLLRRGQPAAKEAPKAHAGPPTPPEPVTHAGAAATTSAQPAAVLAERASAADAAPESPLPGAPAPVSAPAKAAESVVAEESAPPRRLGPARVLVRVKQTVAPFVGTDLRQYRLAAEDVAALPREVAHALVQRGFAQALGG